ncbi:Muconate cycloisomerase 1 [Myriangium duriaei CBS 260.36]|uniref:Muconate cycloisomerase 1 n=1 Tax=Myriangium duriaei CBS 260.36 TaxID=1168546 RepID=A0A9P4J697_9PEZI|nr:Muconate cycloisomerase 1 [Myriangium duriaei CBS 260.36]
MDFLVGTFRSPLIFTLRFTPPDSLEIIHSSTACGGHSWLSLSEDHKFLYATVWSSPPSIAAYQILTGGTVKLINTKPVRSLSGYTTCTTEHVFTVGGPTGEAFAVRADGGLGDLVQELSFRKPEELSDGARDVAHGNFGGLRHGAHSVDIAPDGRSLYVADIGHNCIWTYALDESNKTRPLQLKTKHISPRQGDGPRHTWPHPNGKVLYSLQEHSSIVDVFSVAHDGTSLQHIQGVKIIPANKDAVHYWADEVRLSKSADGPPKYLYASTRGLENETMGYVAAFKIDMDGMIIDSALHIWKTPTSGGLANAIEPSPPVPGSNGLEFLALTDSQDGLVFILSFDGRVIREVARVQLKTGDGVTATAATAVWL